MEVLIKKWGNSASIRIPHSVMTAANLHVDQAVEVGAEAVDVDHAAVVREVHRLRSHRRSPDAANRARCLQGS